MRQAWVPGGFVGGEPGGGECHRRHPQAQLSGAPVGLDRLRGLRQEQPLLPVILLATRLPLLQIISLVHYMLPYLFASCAAGL